MRWQDPKHVWSRIRAHLADQKAVWSERLTGAKYAGAANLGSLPQTVSGNHRRTLLIPVTRAYFDADVPNANFTLTLGMCRGFESLGIPYVFVDANQLHRIVDQVPGPFCFMHGHDYPFLTRRTLRTLRRVRHFVFISSWFPDRLKYFAAHGIEKRKESLWEVGHIRRVLDAEPQFGMFHDTESCLQFYSEWERQGLKVLPVPLACDTSLYSSTGPAFADPEIEIAFVGGYWKTKSTALDAYLKPLESQLTIFGYSKWPYQGYRGLLDAEDEPALYRTAKLCPTINEPTVSAFVGLNERVFKVLGCGGCTIVDAVPRYSELFSASELPPIPSGPAEFIELANELLRNQELRKRYANAGRTAVLTRHTYQHRAQAILDQLEIAPPNHFGPTPCQS